jgi:predicted alpha/beta-hydrolase family hydrolase
VTWTVDVGDEQTTAVWDPPAGASAVTPVFVCAHGAGGQMNDRSMLAVRDALTAEGLGVVRFNFLYRAKGSARPDPMPRLLACWSAVVDHVRRELSPEILILGGRSMGGRAASMFVADGATCDGLLLLAYPLHPPGATDKLRAEHLSAIGVPVLCFNGTRDAFCERPLMEDVVAKLGSNWRMHWIEGADHGFHVPKRSGRTDAQVMAEVAAETRAWVKGLRPA